MRIAWMTGFDLFGKNRSRQVYIFPNLLDGADRAARTDRLVSAVIDRRYRRDLL
jgi:hypothetical protein